MPIARSSAKTQRFAMDQETAQHLFRQGALFVLLDLPLGSEFGIDYNSWTVGPKFRGVKMIPPGIHFVYYSAVDRSGQTAPRTGFFYNFQQREVVTRKWDNKLEDISDTPVSADDQERIENNREELDRFLGAYPYENYKKWISLTNHITPSVLGSLQPLSGKISSVAQTPSQSSTTASRAASESSGSEADNRASQSEMNTVSQSERGLSSGSEADLLVVAGSELRFSALSKQTYPPDSSPEQVTRYSLDYSYALETLLAAQYSASPLLLLAELQLAFVCFLLAQALDGFEQWKRLVRLLCMCDEALETRPQLFSQFISVLHHQLYEIPQDFFVDIVTNNNFLVTVLHTFFDNLANSNTQTSLKDRGQKFLKHLQKKFNWSFTQEADEDHPVVVE